MKTTVQPNLIQSLNQILSLLSSTIKLCRYLSPVYSVIGQSTYHCKTKAMTKLLLKKNTDIAAKNEDK